MLKQYPLKRTVALIALAAVLGSTTLLRRAEAANTCSLARPEVKDALETQASEYLYNNVLLKATAAAERRGNSIADSPHPVVHANLDQLSRRLKVVASFHTLNAGHLSLKLENTRSPVGYSAFELQVDPPLGELSTSYYGQTTRTCRYTLINPYLSSSVGHVFANDYQVGPRASQILETDVRLTYFQLDVEVPALSR